MRTRQGQRRGEPITLHRTTALLVVALTLLGACGGGEDTQPSASDSPTPTHSPYIGYPSSIVALGHSNLTGVRSDPQRPTGSVLANSWATGTNPTVNSLFLRILAVNPAIEGRAFNLAQNGALISALRGQATRAASLDPKPDLVVIMIGDNDLVCPATAESKDEFLTSFASALDTVAQDAPTTRIFVTSLFGSPTKLAKVLSPDERKSIGGTGPCDYFDPDGRLVESKLALREEARDAIDAQLEAGCKRISLCRHDGGAFGRVDIERADYAQNDILHLSLTGHAKAAAVAWDALKRAGLIPQ